MASCAGVGPHSHGGPLLLDFFFIFPVWNATPSSDWLAMRLCVLAIIWLEKHSIIEEDGVRSSLCLLYYLCWTTRPRIRFIKIANILLAAGKYSFVFATGSNNHPSAFPSRLVPTVQVQRDINSHGYAKDKHNNHANAFKVRTVELKYRR